MLDCTCLIHPFQNDPGTSQRQRTMEDLLAGAAKIDARTLADLLDYFVQLSGHINYYDLELNVKDWKPFFNKSIPFALAAMIKYPVQNAEENFDLYKSIFEKRPSATGLQLNSFFIYYRFINTINDWQLVLKDSGLPMSQVIDDLIKSKLQQPLKWFIRYANAAVKAYGIKRIDFTKLSANAIWGIDLADIYAIDTSFSAGTKKKSKKLRNLYNEFSTLFPILLNAIKIISKEAERNLEKSFIPLKEELQQQHQPQLALIFVFLNMFRQLQDDLNTYKQKHLDYFYKDILQFKSAAAIADKAHVIFEIQKQLQSYLLKKGLMVKDGKDVNKQQILFALDDDIVVTKTAIADKRTLFLNNKNSDARTYVEGVYMAPVAEMADGVEKAFKDDPKNFPTVGAKYSKYEDPETKLFKPYPNARLGFILASPVLFLQEGSTRTIDINLTCEIERSLCGAIGSDIIAASKNCCNDFNPPGTAVEKNKYPEFYPADGFYDYVNAVLLNSYYYINQDMLKDAVKKGLSSKLADQLKKLFLTEETDPLCYCPVEKIKYETTLTAADYLTNLNSLTEKLTASEQAIVDEIIKPRKALNLLFSGEKGWVEASSIDKLELLPGLLSLTAPANQFTFHIKATLNPDKPAVTFYDKEKLKEDFGTTQPLVKIELDDKIKFTNVSLSAMPKPPADKDACCVQDPHCCLLKEEQEDDISLYHFFRNVLVSKIADADKDKPIITVDVCGLKNFIVQNDEAVMDVNGPIYPFGSRPDIIDFGVTDLVVQYVITAAFVADVQPHIAASTTAILNGLIPASGIYEVGNNYADIESFLVANILVPADVITIRTQLQSKNYSKQNLNLTGPNFFIGSKEIFCKHWTEVFVNLNWKDKPSDFRDYYKAYLSQKDYINAGKKIFGLDDQEFEINLSLLENGKWISELKHEDPPPGPPYAEETTLYNTFTAAYNRRLFPKISTASPCIAVNPFQQTLHLKNSYFSIVDQFTLDATSAFTKYDVNSRNGFLRINLQNQDFLHKDFGYVLARQMNAAAMLAILDTAGNPKKVEGAVYYDSSNGGLVVFSTDNIKNNVANSLVLAGRVRDDINAPMQISDLANNPGSGNPINPGDADSIRSIINPASLLEPLNLDLTTDVETLKTNINDINNQINSGKDFQAIIPKEPWTPVISNMAIDYKAAASSKDIDLIHVHPYQNTYRQQELAAQPTLFPTFCDEGSLFLGLKDLVPGDNLNILFQLAEATSDSEADKEEVYWYYLDSNVWKPLRNGFEVLDDATKELTTSGIVKLALPANMTNDNTIMPKDLYWIKATIAKNSRAVSETISILPQAMLAIFTNDEANDKTRLAIPLAAGGISKLNVADASVKSVAQPFASFGGGVPELENQFYVRVSETLRHKSRAIQAFDYERLALQAFPELYKVKCINHSFALNAHEYTNDFPYAPGYVMLAVIPDLNKLNAGNSFEPKVPVSIIEDIQTFMHKRTSPFVRFRAMNPRYEKINFCLRVRLMKGKDENYFREKIKQDIREFMAPWAVGVYDKLTFGQCVYRSDIIGLLEKSGYVDFIADFRMGKENDKPAAGAVKVCPDTPRSILIAGDIEVCIEKAGCEKWATDFKKCAADDKPVAPCNKKPELFIDYRKKK